MNRFFFILALVLPVVLQGKVTSKHSADSLFAIANKCYTDGKYSEAVQNYEAIIATGKTCAELYFNLGNSYFKQNDIPHAILNYERAYLLNPGDEDIRFNLELARAYTTDKIDAIPEFFIVKWIQSLSNLFSSNTWALFSLMLFVTTLCLLSIFQFSGKYGIKKNAFVFSWVTAFLFMVALTFSILQKNRIVNSNHAIITTSVVAVKSSPAENSSDLFILHAGTKVETLRPVGEWYEIRIANGNKGWLPRSSFEKI